MATRRKYTEIGRVQGSGPPTAEMSTLMKSEAGIGGMGSGLWVSSVVVTSVARSLALSKVYQSAREPGSFEGRNDKLRSLGRMLA